MYSVYTIQYTYEKKYMYIHIYIYLDNSENLQNSVGSTPSAPKSSAGSVLSIHNLQNHSAVFTRIITNPGKYIVSIQQQVLVNKMSPFYV